MKKAISILLACLFTATAWASQAVNINTATAEEISEALTGIGQSKAEAIVEYRRTHGHFKHADELVNVKGIGLSTVDRNRGYILVYDQAGKDKQSG
jgi:competence protein ComEA